jgi:tetratricopeptide (TPR) repeat protein
LGALYKSQGKLEEAEKMYSRALVGKEKAWGPDHTSTLSTVNNLGLLYYSQGKLEEAEKMYSRALVGKEKAWGPDHTSTLSTVNILGLTSSPPLRNALCCGTTTRYFDSRAIQSAHANWDFYNNMLEILHSYFLIFNDRFIQKIHTQSLCCSTLVEHVEISQSALLHHNAAPHYTIAF